MVGGWDDKDEGGWGEGGRARVGGARSHMSCMRPHHGVLVVWGYKDGARGEASSQIRID